MRANKDECVGILVATAIWACKFLVHACVNQMHVLFGPLVGISLVSLYLIYNVTTKMNKL